MNPTLSNWLLWLSACVAFASLLSQLAAPCGWRRPLSSALALGSLCAPWLAPPKSPVLRAAVALYLIWTCTKVFDMTRDRQQRSPFFRWVWMLALHDLRRDGYARHGARPDFRPGLLASALFALGVTLASLHLALFVAPTLTATAGWLVRHGAGILVCYFGVEGALRTFEFVERWLGLSPPILHQHPILSLSLAEFWGRRWNRVVGHWLFGALYRPVALRGRPALAVVAAFVGSAVLHQYFTWAAIGFGWSLIIASFFLLQVPLVLVEAALGQPRWPRPLRRAWTLAVLGLSSPLFVAPTLVTLGRGFE